MNCNFVLILVVILVVGSLYFSYQKGNLKTKEDFNNLSQCVSDYPSKSTDHASVHHLKDSKLTSDTYNDFSYQDFKNNFQDILIKYMGITDILGQSKETNRRYSSDLKLSIHSVDKIKNTAGITFYNFDHQAMLKLNYNAKQGTIVMTDYSGGSPKKTSWKAAKNNQTFGVIIMAHRNANDSWTSHLITDDVRPHKCYPISDLTEFLSKLKYVQMTVDPQTKFKAKIIQDAQLWDPLKAPMIESHQTSNYQRVSNGPYAGSFYRPKGPSGYYSLGEHGYRAGDAQTRGILGEKNRKALMLKKGPHVKTPQLLQWQWDNKEGIDKDIRKNFFRQMSFKEDGKDFVCLGDYYDIGRPRRDTWIRRSGKTNSAHPHVCIDKKCLEGSYGHGGSGGYTRAYHDKASGAEQDGSGWTNYYSGSASEMHPHKKGYPGHLLLSLNNSHYNRVPFSPWRKTIVKASCLARRAPDQINSSQLVASINSGLTKQKGIFAKKVSDGLTRLMRHAANLRETGRNIAKNERELVNDRRDNYDQTISHNNEMDKRNKEYLQRTLFLKKMKTSLDTSAKYQNASNKYLNSGDIYRRQYDQELTKSRKLSEKNNDLRDKEGEDAVVNVNYALNLKVSEINTPNNPAKLFT